jgi:hypothetical protein
VEGNREVLFMTGDMSIPRRWSWRPTFLGLLGLAVAFALLPPKLQVVLVLGAVGVGAIAFAALLVLFWYYRI